MAPTSFKVKSSVFTVASTGWGHCYLPVVISSDVSFVLIFMCHQHLSQLIIAFKNAFHTCLLKYTFSWFTADISNWQLQISFCCSILVFSRCYENLQAMCTALNKENCSIEHFNFLVFISLSEDFFASTPKIATIAHKSIISANCIIKINISCNF